MAKAYMITYDLNSPGQNYDQIIKIIKENISLSWCSFWKSSYLIKSNLSTKQIQEKIQPYLDSSDRMIIIEVNNNYQGWSTEDDWKFIRESIFG